MVNAYFCMPELWVTPYQLDLLLGKVEELKTEGLRSVAHALRAYVTDPPHPNKTQNPGHQGMGEFPWLVTLGVCCHTSLLRELSSLCVTARVENWKLAAGPVCLDSTHPVHPFPLLILICILVL